MSDEKQEKIADIVAEMRLGVKDWRGERVGVFDCFADRIEAAWTREREAGAEAAQICGEIGEMIGREAAGRQPVTNCNRLGNAAAMREALRGLLEIVCIDCNSSYKVDGKCVKCPRVVAAESALAAPPRNCDRPECATTKAAQDVWRKEDGGKTAYYEWLLSTSMKGEAK